MSREQFVEQESSLHCLILLSNCSFLYNRVYRVDQVLSICDVIVSPKLCFNGKFKRRTPSINMSVRDEGSLVIVV